MSQYRFYFSLTNKCNTECEFCCMNSGVLGRTYLSFEDFKNAIDSVDCHFELQLEGGEPFLHRHIFLFLEYAYSTGRCDKVVISTNGILLNDYLGRLTAFCAHSGIPMVVKRSINFHLYRQDSNIFKKCRDLYLATEFIDGFDVQFNVRIEKGDTEIISLLKEHKIIDQSVVYEFQRYGRYSDNEQYDEPFIEQNIDDWGIYASDGKCFDKDLVARSLYEKGLR